MGRIYTHKLADGSVDPLHDLTIANTTAGTVIVVRSIDMMNHTPPPRGLLGFQVFSPASQLVWGVGPDRANAYEAYHWEGRQALEDGDTMTVSASDNLWGCWITGFILTP